MNQTDYIRQSREAPHERRLEILKEALEKGVFEEAAIFHDLEYLENTCDELLKAEYPQGTLHYVAVKANPLVGILKVIARKGLGAEVATIGELHAAVKSGFPMDKIVYDSPVKSLKDLTIALKMGVTINADNFDELERIKSIMSEDIRSKIGVRVNPQVGLGTIQGSSTAGAVSKFGIPLESPDNKDRLIKFFKENPWLIGLHCHVGSQGCSINLLIQGISKTYGLLKLINAETNGQVKYLDMGGGLSIDYTSDTRVSFQSFARQLSETLPDLYTSKIQIMTEYGRAIMAKSGFVASQVVDVKQSHNVTLALTHVGADLFVRNCLLPEQWPLRIFVTDEKGKQKLQDIIPQSIYGPLCFSGDRLCHDRDLPRLQSKDWLIIPDTGGYTLSMWSMYNSRLIPSVWLKTRQGLECIRRQSTVDDILFIFNNQNL